MSTMLTRTTAFLFVALALVACGDDDGGSSTCGNGVLEGGEMCDGDMLSADMDTCEEVHGDGATGTVMCKADCTIDHSMCQMGAGGAGGGTGG